MTINKYKEIVKSYNKEITNKNVEPKLLYKSEDTVQRLLTDLIELELDLVNIYTSNKEVFDEVDKKIKEANKNIKLESTAEDILDMYDRFKETS